MAGLLAVRTETLTSCPNCGGNEISFWVSGRDRLLKISDQVFTYSRCSRCGITFQSTRPVESEIRRFYPEDYHQYQPQYSAPKASVIRRYIRAVSRWIVATVTGERRFREKIDRFYDVIREGIIFLDFGCGSGKFLSRSVKFGCRTIGMDFSPIARAEAAKKGHEALPIDAAGWAKIPEGTVDLVRMNHVVEHLYTPRETLARIYAKMANGARLHVAVPNPRGLSARMFRSRWRGLDCPRHVILFTPEALVEVLQDIGFRNIRVIHEPLTKDQVRSWGYVLEDLRLMRATKVEDLIESPLFAALCALPAAVCTAIRWSDRFHILAEKQHGMRAFLKEDISEPSANAEQPAE